VRPRQGSIKKRAAGPPQSFTESSPSWAPIRKEAVVLNAMHGQSTGLAPQRKYLVATDPRLPNAFVGIVAFGVTLVVAVVLARVGTAFGWATQLGVMAATVGFVCWWSRVLPGIFVSTCAWLMLNGILVNGAGRLGWDGRHDLVRACVLLGVGLVVGMARELELHLRLRAASANNLGDEIERHLYIVTSTPDDPEFDADQPTLSVRRGDHHA
jgi:hypothetical protein